MLCEACLTCNLCSSPFQRPLPCMQHTASSNPTPCQTYSSVLGGKWMPKCSKVCVMNMEMLFQCMTSNQSGKQWNMYTWEFDLPWGACQLSHTHTTLLVNMERHSHPFWQTYQQARMLCAEVASVAMSASVMYKLWLDRVYMQWYLWEDIIWVSVRWCWGLSYFLSLNWCVCFVTATPASALCRACVSVPCWHISCPCSPTKGYRLSHLHQQVTASEFQAWEELPQTHLPGN